MQSNKKSFKGQKIFIGIDVHAKTWAVETLTESGFTKRHAQEASAKVLFDFLSKNFPDGEYHAVYESGFSGFSTYYQLKEYGIHCVVVHAADVPSTQYEQVMKTDKIDAGKLARALRKGDIKPIYIRERENLDDRAVVRLRKTIQKQLSGYKTRVKHLLHTNGVKLPEAWHALVSCVHELAQGRGRTSVINTPFPGLARQPSGVHPKELVGSYKGHENTRCHGQVQGQLRIAVEHSWHWIQCCHVPVDRDIRLQTFRQ